METTNIPQHRNYALEIIADLTQNQTEKHKQFIDRCNKGRLYLLKDKLLSDEYDISFETKEYIRILLEEMDGEDTSLPESGEYIYCSLSFDSSERTYYYKTTDETLKCDDEVVVAVGAQEKEAIAKIKKIERFPANKTPYPPSLTKDILRKC